MANEPTDMPLLHLTCQHEPTTSTILKNPEHIASPVQENSYNKDIFMIEMKYMSPNKNSKSLDRTHKTGNKHQSNIKKKWKLPNQKSYCNYRNAQQYYKHFEGNGQWNGRVW